MTNPNIFSFSLVRLEATFAPHPSRDLRESTKLSTLLALDKQVIVTVCTKCYMFFFIFTN